MTDVINNAEDGVFASFCRKIKVTNIREYEERQLKVAQEESEARLRFDTQIVRLTHQYVPLFRDNVVRTNCMILSDPNSKVKA